MWRAGVAEGLKILEPQVPDGEISRAQGSEVVGSVLASGMLMLDTYVMTGDSWNDGIRIEGRPEPPAKEDTGAGWARVMPGFFEIIGAKVLLGRPLSEQDTAATRKVAVGSK